MIQFHYSPIRTFLGAGIFVFIAVLSGILLWDPGTIQEWSSDGRRGYFVELLQSLPAWILRLAAAYFLVISLDVVLGSFRKVWRDFVAVELGVSECVLYLPTGALTITRGEIERFSLETMEALNWFSKPTSWIEMVPKSAEYNRRLPSRIRRFVPRIISLRQGPLSIEEMQEVLQTWVVSGLPHAQKKFEELKSESEYRER